ncbi:hypothetical protein KW438_10135 [Vibrio fluvialis]|nr:hypothetical protein [Vibrio fluvialis]
MKNAPTAVMGIPHSHIATKSVRKQNALSPPDLKMPLIITMLIIFRLTAILSIVIAGFEIGKNCSESIANKRKSKGFVA